MLARAWGLARSLVVYHGQPGRQRRMRRFYSEFLQPGDVGFDVGAHVGSRVRAWRRLGALVVAVEPQPDCIRVLRLLYARDPRVVIEPVALGATVGTARLAVSSAAPTVSTLSAEWIETVRTDRRFSRVKWDRSIEVRVTTLDALVTRYGAPAFCKIDVEGFELDVLAGLSRPLRALSFEYLPQAHDDGLTVLARVDQLGDYEYRYSPVETMRFTTDHWLDAGQLTQLLEEVRPRGRSGDVYARLVPH